MSELEQLRKFFKKYQELEKAKNQRKRTGHPIWNDECKSLEKELEGLYKETKGVVK